MHPSPRHLSLAAAVLAALTLSACADQALVDRVAQVEASQDRLRSSLTELGAPDPDAQAARDAAAAEVALVADRIADVETAIAAVGADLDAQSLEVDGRVTTAELQLDELRAMLVQLGSDLTALTDRVSSLEAQFGAHRGDPFGHNG